MNYKKSKNKKTVKIPKINKKNEILVENTSKSLKGLIKKSGTDLCYPKLLDLAKQTYTENETALSTSDESLNEEKSTKRKKAYLNGIIARKKIKALPDYEYITKLFYDEFPHNVKYVRKWVNFWNTQQYTRNMVENCYLRHDWNNLTRLLMILTDKTNWNFYYLNKMTLLNGLFHPASQECEFMEKLLKEGYNCHTEEAQKDIINQYLFNINNPESELKKVAE